MVKRRNAEGDYALIGDDDFNLDDCCYNLQQCIEMTLKHIVTVNGERYVENHDIRAQLNKLDEMDIDVPGAERLRDMASSINSWEAQSRYSESFVATMRDVDEARKLADDLLDFAKGMVVETETDGSFPEGRI